MIKKKSFEKILNKKIENIQKGINIFKNSKNLHTKIFTLVEKINNLKFNKNKIIIFGNGGSAAESQHFSAELVGRFLKNRYPISSISLNTDTSAITAIANDYGYSKIFSRQISALAHADDIVFAISTSGKSSNILSGLKQAKQLGCFTILLTSKKIKKNNFTDLIIGAPGNRVDLIQELHLFIIHAICELVETNINAIKK